MEVPGDACVDAILAVLGTLLPPADDPCEEPGVLVPGGVRSAAVSLASVLLFGAVPSAEHEAGHVVAAAPLAIGAVHVRHLHLLKRGRLAATKTHPSPATDQRCGGVLHQELGEVFGAEADWDDVVGKGDGCLEAQEGDIMVVLAFLGIIARVADDLVHLMITLGFIISLCVMFPWQS